MGIKVTVQIARRQEMFTNGPAEQGRSGQGQLLFEVNAGPAQQGSDCFFFHARCVELHADGRFLLVEPNLSDAIDLAQRIDGAQFLRPRLFPISECHIEQRHKVLALPRN